LRNFVPLLFLIISPVLAEENPFMAVRDRDQWAIEQVMEHKVPDDSWYGNPSGVISSIHLGKKSKQVALATATPFQTKNYTFQTETDEAKVSAGITDFGSNFVIDISSDQVIQGWLLKRQSTREVFLKGGTPSDNPYKCRIKVDRPYIKDFGLTVYVTQDSDPAFVQLF
jgi:hypothetical protein